MKINRQSLKLMPLRLMAGAGLIMASFLSEATALPFKCARCNMDRNLERCATDSDFFKECEARCPIEKKNDPIQKCREAHKKATLPPNIIKDAIKAPCEARQSFIDMEEQVSKKMGRTPYSEKEKEFILTGCPASTPTPEKRPLSLQEEALQKRENLKKASRPDTTSSENVPPRPVSPHLKSASPTHVTQPTQPARKTAVEGSAEDLHSKLAAYDKLEIHRLTADKKMTTDQMLKAIEKNPKLVNNPENVVKYLEKLKEEEGATSPAHEEKGAAEEKEVAHTPPPAAHIPPSPLDLLSPPDSPPPPLPSSVEAATSSVEKAPSPKRGVGTAFLTPPPPLRLPPQNSAPQNVQ